MTITLDYTDLHFDDDSEVLRAGELEFEFELLFAQIVFRVDAADFTFEEYTTLLDAAAILRGRVRELADGGTNTYESPVSGETLIFARSADHVAISANYTEATATVSRAELNDAVTEFHQRVTRDLLVRYPGLAENPNAAKYLALDGQGSSLGA
jgi:hypothetical protein